MTATTQASITKREFKTEKIGNSSSQTDKPSLSPLINSPIHQIYSLQRTVGNREVERLLKSGVIQAKLKVNEPGDVYEQEADRIADRVMATPAHPATNGAAPPHIQRFTGQPTGQMDAAPASIYKALASPGRPFEPALQQDMEQRFGYDFSKARVHSGAAAEQSAREVNANAYTVGHHIVFGAGRFAPATQEGRRLIAHELAHVVQQSAADGNRVAQNNKHRGRSTIFQPVAEGRAIAPTVQRQPTPPAEIEMPTEYAFARDKRKRTDKRYARALGQQDAARIRKSGKLSSEDRDEVNAKLRFFEGEAWEVYKGQIKLALVEVTREEIEMPAEPERTSPGGGPSEPSAELAKYTTQPTYVDNNMKKISFYTAELAIIHYRDGSSLELGLVPRWMKPPVEEVDYRTPREEYRLRHDAKEGISFIRESDLQKVPRSMPWAEVQKLYARPISFSVQAGTGRVVPSRVNRLTAPKLCEVLLESETKYLKETQWIAQWGIEVTKVVGGMGASGGAGKLAAGPGSRVVSRIATSRAGRKLAGEMDNLLAAGSTKTITMEGMVFADVQLAVQGSRLAVRRFESKIPHVLRGKGLGSRMNAAFEEAAVSVAYMNGVKTVTINVGIITNPGWRVLMEARGYVFNRAEGAWIKTITL